MQKIALERYNKLKGTSDERLVSSSDDHTLFMWDPVKKDDPKIRLTGHQQPVINVRPKEIFHLIMKRPLSLQMENI